MTIDEAEKIKTVVENKDYIVQLVNTVAKTLVEAFENLKIEDVNMFQLGYNKAIDDFSTDIINKINFEHKWLFDCKSNNADTDIAFSALITFINELAEHLKTDWILIVLIIAIASHRAVLLTVVRKIEK